MFRVTYETKDEGQTGISKAYPTDSGFDIYSHSVITIKKGERTTYDTGIKFQIKLPWYLTFLHLFGVGIEAQIRPKSGRSKTGIDVELGTVDEPYTGFTGVTITNTTKKEFTFLKGEKIAQIVFVPVFNRIKVVKGKVEDTKTRGANGFGSTDKK